MNPALEILRVPTAPGFEDKVVEFVEAWLQSLKIAWKKDQFGNLIALIPGLKNKKGLAFSVHMDHPGFAVQKVNGAQIECEFRGGVPKSYFKKGVQVAFFDPSAELQGMGHVEEILQWEEKKRNILLNLESGSVHPSGFGMWRLPILKLQAQKKLITNRVCDDLAGCAAVLAMLSLIQSKKESGGIGNVYALFTRREEVGLEGAFEVAASKILPQNVPVISVETSKALSNAPQGMGPIVRVGDRTSIFDPVMTKQLCQVGESMKEKMPSFSYQRKLMDGGTCEATAYLEKGYRAGGLCVALGNYHNCGSRGKIMAENIHEEDWNGLVQFMVETVQKMS